MLFYNLFLLSITSIRYIIIDDRFARSANTYTTGFKGIGLNDAFLHLGLGLIYVHMYDETDSSDSKYRHAVTINMKLNNVRKYYRFIIS